MPVTVYGASDDLIELEGDIREEFTLRDEDEGDLIAFSNGVLLRVAFTNDGLWKIHQIGGDRDRVVIEPATGPDDDAYSDRATVAGSVTWVVQGSAWRGAGRG